MVKKVNMTKQELIEKYKELKDKIFIESFKTISRIKVERAKTKIELLDLVIKDLEKLDQQSLAMETKDIRRLYSSLRVQCKGIGLVNLLAGFSLYLDAEIDFYDMQASEENREPLKSVFRNEFEKLSSMKSDVDTCINALVNKYLT